MRSVDNMGLALEIISVQPKNMRRLSRKSRCIFCRLRAASLASCFCKKPSLSGATFFRAQTEQRPGGPRRRFGAAEHNKRMFRATRHASFLDQNYAPPFSRVAMPFFAARLRKGYF